jgi:hypothetical protein
MTPTYCIQEMQTALACLPLPNPAFLAAFLVGVLTCQKARFAKIAQSMPGEAQPKSQQMRLTRYLDHPRLLDSMAQTLLALLPIDPPFILALDRTNWKIGKRNVNLLVLAVIVGKTAVPLLWQDLTHPGNSDTEPRIALIKRFLTLLGNQARSKIRLITADREFVGADWLAWLLEEKLPFLIRIRKDDLLTRSDGTCQQAWEYFALRADGCRNKKQAWDLWGTPVYVGGKRLLKGDWLIVVSNCCGADLLKLYRHRWGIETLFQALKGRGFDLEGCTTRRIEGFFGLLALALVWCIRNGMALEGRKPSKLLKHGRMAVSWFRKGLDFLHRLLAPLAGYADREGFERAIELLRRGALPAKHCL